VLFGVTPVVFTFYQNMPQLLHIIVQRERSLFLQEAQGLFPYPGISSFF
jgi:hypothetical protein